jgi:hypothetical protein
MVATNLSGSCSTTARSQSSFQRSLVSPRKVSPPNWDRPQFSILLTEICIWYLRQKTEAGYVAQCNFAAKQLPGSKSPGSSHLAHAPWILEDLTG